MSLYGLIAAQLKWKRTKNYLQDNGTKRKLLAIDLTEYKSVKYFMYANPVCSAGSCEI